MIEAILSLGSKIFERVFPNKEAAQAANLKLLELAQSGELARLMHESKVIEAQSSIIKAEANSDSWLARNWRPLLMVTFAGLIVARWFGFSAPNISQQEYMELWNIIKLGVGGYVIGRSAEKIANAVDFKSFLKK